MSTGPQLIYTGSVPYFALLLLLLFGSYGCSKRGEGDSAERAPAATEKAELATQDDAAPAAGGDLGYGEDARLFDSAADAVAEIVKSHPRVLGFGEFHKLNGSAPVRSALQRFASEIFDVVGPHSAHLVLETWSVDPSCGKKGKEVTRTVEKAIERPPETENEMQMLLRKAQSFGTASHVLAFSCEEYAALLGKDGLDTDALLTSVSAKLGQSASAALAHTAQDKMVLVYGGATHNNLFPYQGLEAWSYAPELAAREPGYVEIDLYVPELVEGDKLLQGEAWYPLLREARADKVILIRRDPKSYILLMRKGLAAETGQPAQPEQPAQPGSADGQNDGQQAKKK